jgi:phosphoribosyl-ATP pyrophosphohydrolase
MSAEVFDELGRLICGLGEQDLSKKSYIRHRVFHLKGIDKSLEKVGEESCEFVIAVKTAM